MKQSVYTLFIFLLCCHNGFAQIPVEKEPHHKVVLQNKYLRLIDGRIPYGDTTLGHIHSAESVVLFLSKSTFGIGVAGEKPVITDVNPGDVRYSPYGTKPVNHKVWNQTKPMFHFLVAELVNKYPAKDTCSVITQPGVKVKVMQPLVRVYAIDLVKGRQLNIPKSSCPHLLIDISGNITIGSVSKSQHLTPDKYVYFAPGNKIWIKCNGSKKAKCVLIEMK